MASGKKPFSPETNYWQAVDLLLQEHTIVIDRPKGSAHPRYPETIYPLDYGYLENTSSADGEGVDVWLGSLPEKTLTGILVTLDMQKHDSEIKLLVGCTNTETQAALTFLNQGAMRAEWLQRR